MAASGYRTSRPARGLNRRLLRPEARVTTLQGHKFELGCINSHYGILLVIITVLEAQYGQKAQRSS